MHWFPWNGGAQQLTRLEAYTRGTAVIIGVPIVAMLIAYFSGINRNELFWAVLLIINTLVSGMTVSLAYWIDSKRTLTLEDDHAAKRN